MANYNVTITNGAGSAKMKAGNYNVTVNANGYDDHTLAPTKYTAKTTAGSGAFTLRASGTLTFIVNEEGEKGKSTRIKDGLLVMTNENGSTKYGDPVRISNGVATFENVPHFACPGFPLFFKQLASDDEHNLYDGMIEVMMNEREKTVYIKNTPIAAQRFTLCDANYNGLPINSATLTFKGA